MLHAVTSQPPAPQEPRKRALPWLLGGGAVLVAAVVVLVVVLTSGPDTSTPQGVAEAVVDALNDEEYTDLVDLACADYRDELGNMVAPSGQGAALAEVDPGSGDEAGATITLDGDARLELGLRREQDQWCVSFFG